MLTPELSNMKFYGEFKIAVNQEIEKYELYNSVESEKCLYKITSDYIELLARFGINKRDIRIEDNLFCSFINKYSSKDIYLLMWFPESVFNYGFRYKLAKTNREKNPSLTDAKFIILLGHGNTIEEIEKTHFKENIITEKDCCFFVERRIVVDQKILITKTGNYSGQDFSISFAFKRDYKNVVEYLENIIKTNLKKYQ